MKVRTNRAELADAVAWVCRVIAKNPTHHALSGVRLTTEEGEVVVEGTNFEVSHSAAVECEVGDDGSVLVSGHMLRDLLAAMKGETVDLYVAAGALVVASGRSLYRARLMEVADFPALGKMPDLVGEVDAGALSAIAEAVTYPIDDAAPVESMRGLHIEGSDEDDELVAVGLINHAVATAGCEWSGSMGFEATLPTTALTGAIRGLSGAVRLGYEDGTFGMADDARQVVARCFAQQYAPWQAVLKAAVEVTHHAVVDPGDLLAATKRTMIVAGDATIDLSFTEGEVVLSATGAEAGDGEERVEAECEAAGDFRIGPRYLIDTLAAIPSGKVEIGWQVGPALKPLVFKPLDHPRMTSLLQPRKIPGGN